MGERILEPGPNLFSLHTVRPLLPPPATREDPRWDLAWDHIARVYTPALRRYAFARLKARLGGRMPDAGDAEAVVQDFLLRAMQSGQLADSHTTTGSIRMFRAWIARQLDRAVGDHLDKTFAKRRDPGRTVPEDAILDVPAPDAASALESLDKGFVQIGVERALARLDRGEGSPKWGRVYAAIVRSLLANDGVPAPDLPERLGFPSSGLPLHKLRARKKFGELFVDELRKTVRHEEDLDELLRTVDPFLP
jgi:DNA-directed RNA polymerase specialized sigma24 family protein